MDVAHVARSVVHMASLPLDANIPFMTIMATAMPLPAPVTIAIRAIANPFKYPESLELLVTHPKRLRQHGQNNGRRAPTAPASPAGSVRRVFQGASHSPVRRSFGDGPELIP